MQPLCAMCPTMEFFLVRIFLHSDRIQTDTKYLSVFSLNAGKYRPEKTLYLDPFHAVNRTRNHNPLVCKWTVNHLAKPLQSLNFQISYLLWAKSSLTSPWWQGVDSQCDMIKTPSLPWYLILLVKSFKVGLSLSKKTLFYLLQWRLLKND